MPPQLHTCNICYCLHLYNCLHFFLFLYNYIVQVPVPVSEPSFIVTLSTVCATVVGPLEPERLPVSNFIVSNPDFSRTIYNNSTAKIVYALLLLLYFYFITYSFLMIYLFTLVHTCKWQTFIVWIYHQINYDASASARCIPAILSAYREGGQLKLCVVPSLPYKPAVKRWKCLESVLQVRPVHKIFS